jgi:aromatic-L-amino-acid/L-tryptophan decarboxylase
MSIQKSVARFWIGRSNLRLIATHESSRMIPEELDATIIADKAADKTPLAVVALAGSVSTGAIDPLRQIAEVPHRHGAGFDTDGAHGALAVIAARQKFDGIELAIRCL